MDDPISNVKKPSGCWYHAGCLITIVSTLLLAFFVYLIFESEEDLDRIDSDLNGVLSHDEITAEINKDIKENDDALIISGVGGISLAALGLGLYKLTGKVSKIALAMAALDGLLALRSVLQAKKLEKRIAQGHN